MQALQEIGSISGKLAAGGLASPCSLHSEPPPGQWEALRGRSGISLPVVRLRPVRVLGEVEAEAGGRGRALESAADQLSSAKSSCT